MRLVLFALALLTAKPLVAEELWACRGFLYSDGSSGNPFILRGDGRTFRYTEAVPMEIEHVADNQVAGFRIFVNAGRNRSRNAYYLRFDGNRLVMRKYSWHHEAAETNCFRQ